MLYQIFINLYDIILRFVTLESISFYFIILYHMWLFYLISYLTIYMYILYVWVCTCVVCPIFAVYGRSMCMFVPHNQMADYHGWCIGSGWGAEMMQQLNYIYSGESWQCNKDDNTKLSICLLQFIADITDIDLPHKWQANKENIKPQRTVTWPLSSTHGKWNFESWISSILSDWMVSNKRNPSSWLGTEVVV